MTVSLERSLAERRRSTIGWCLGAAAYTLVNVAVYPAGQDAERAERPLQGVPAGADVDDGDRRQDPRHHLGRRAT